MSAPDKSLANRQAPGLLERFRADLRRDELRPATATFSDPTLEAAYRGHLVNVELPKIRLIGLGGLVVWYLFAILDILTIKEALADVLVVRCLIVGPIVTGLAGMLWMTRFRNIYGAVIAIGMFAFSLGIIAMIALMPTVGAPPYIIGVLVVLAYSSCFNRIPFTLAASVYILIALVYSGVLIYAGKFTRVDIIAGIFFMWNIVQIAVITHYAQEIRSRQIWRRDRQRALDAAYIEELLIEATAADQSKINFISILSHELRTPLHQIIGFSEVVQQRLQSEGPLDVGGFVDDIRGSAHELLARIGKMLRYADATAGKIKYEIEDISTVDLVETVLVQMRDKAAKREITIDAEALEDVPVMIDHHHTSYALGHLIENAVKATPKGGVIEIKGRAGKDGFFALEIVDKGAGMDAAQLKAAFEPFAQVEQLRTRSRDGLGLGLTLARKIFQDQKAELAIESVKGEGTKATVRLPLAPARPMPFAQEA
ncbi:MAG: sensor histidine kinase [Amphiplicatus sp.]